MMQNPQEQIQNHFNKTQQDNQDIISTLMTKDNSLIIQNIVGKHNSDDLSHAENESLKNDLKYFVQNSVKEFIEQLYEIERKLDYWNNEKVTLAENFWHENKELFKAIKEMTNDKKGEEIVKTQEQIPFYKFQNAQQSKMEKFLLKRKSFIKTTKSEYYQKRKSSHQKPPRKKSSAEHGKMIKYTDLTIANLKKENEQLNDIIKLQKSISEYTFHRRIIEQVQTKQIKQKNNKLEQKVNCLSQKLLKDKLSFHNSKSYQNIGVRKYTYEGICRRNETCKNFHQILNQLEQKQQKLTNDKQIESIDKQIFSLQNKVKTIRQQNKTIKSSFNPSQYQIEMFQELNKQVEEHIDAAQNILQTQLMKKAQILNSLTPINFNKRKNSYVLQLRQQTQKGNKIRRSQSLNKFFRDISKENWNPNMCELSK